MPTQVVHLPSSPSRYNQRDQDNMRRIIERALSSSWSIGAHAPEHEAGGNDELNIGSLAGTVTDAQVPESAVLQHLDDFEALMRFHSS